MPIKAEDIFFVDNKAGIGLEDVYDFLETLHNDVRPVNIHSRKIEYYTSQMRSCVQVLANDLDDKGASLSHLADRAEANVAEYDGQVEITSHKLLTHWNAQGLAVTNAAEVALAQLPNLSDLPALAFKDLPGILHWRKQTLDSIRSGVSTVIQRLTTSVVKALSEQLQRDVADHKEQLETRDKLGSAPVNDIMPPIGSYTYVLGDAYDRAPEQFTSSLGTALSECSSVLAQLGAPIHSACRKLASVAEKCEPVSRFEQIVNGSKTALVGEIDEFFTRVQVYRSAAFARDLRRFSEHVRMGAAFDAEDYGPEDAADAKDKYTQRAIEGLLGDFDMLTTEFKAAAERAMEEAYTLRFDDEANDIGRFRDEYDFDKEFRVTCEGVVRDIERHFRARAQDSWNQTRVAVEDICENARRHRDRVWQEAKDAFTKKACWISVIVTLVVTVGYGAYHVGSADLWGNMPWLAILDIGILVTPCIWSRCRRRGSKRKERERDSGADIEIRAGICEQLDEMVKSTRAEKEIRDQQVTLVRSRWEKWVAKLLREQNLSSFDERLAQLRKKRETYLEIRREFHSALCTFRDGVNSFVID